jgi:hypothetical protein
MIICSWARQSILSRESKHLRWPCRSPLALLPVKARINASDVAEKCLGWYLPKDTFAEVRQLFFDN